MATVSPDLNRPSVEVDRSITDHLVGDVHVVVDCVADRALHRREG